MLNQKRDAFTEASSSCALAMLENAAYIEGELPNLELSEVHRLTIQKLCTDLTGSKHDIFNELGGLPELHSFNMNGALACTDRIVGIIFEDMKQMRSVIQALEADSDAHLAHTLVASAGYKIFSIFGNVRLAAEQYRAVAKVVKSNWF